LIDQKKEGMVVKGRRRRLSFLSTNEILPNTGLPFFSFFEKPTFHYTPSLPL